MSSDSPYESGSSSSHSSPFGFTSYGSSNFNPYLNFDASLLTPSGDEYIYPDGVQRHRRGRFELAFSQIGGSVMTGAAIGGSVGSYRGKQPS